MRELPKLSHSGFIGNNGNLEDIFDANKIEKIKCFIVENIGRRKTINRSASSYNLKHIIEDLIGEYVSNGECIKAFIELGFNVAEQQGGLNAYFNVSSADLAMIKHKRRMNIYAKLEAKSA